MAGTKKNSAATVATGKKKKTVKKRTTKKKKKKQSVFPMKGLFSFLLLAGFLIFSLASLAYVVFFRLVVIP